MDPRTGEMVELVAKDETTAKKEAQEKGLVYVSEHELKLVGRMTPEERMHWAAIKAGNSQNRKGRRRTARNKRREAAAERQAERLKRKNAHKEGR